MDLIGSLSAIRGASGPALIDWEAASEAARRSTTRGELSLSNPDRDTYHADVLTAKAALEREVETPIEVPSTLDVIDRHHWLDRAAAMFDRALGDTLPRGSAVGRTVNTTSAAVTLGLLARQVVAQYDPGLKTAEATPALLVVHPNLIKASESMDVALDRFRPWVLHHELAHAAEFTIAPWLRSYLETRLERATSNLQTGTIDRPAIRELTAAMTAIEGFAELLMDESFEGDVTTLRAKLDAHRAGMGPVRRILERSLGIAAKRAQYERGAKFFRTVDRRYGRQASLAVWNEPANLPTRAELQSPSSWHERVLA